MSQAIIRVDDLHKSFGALEVLKGISLEVDKGDVVCIIGASGSGKSTFLRCVNFLEEPTRGKIYIEDQLMAHDLNTGSFRMHRMAHNHKTPYRRSKYFDPRSNSLLSF